MLSKSVHRKCCWYQVRCT